jgi:hypothetical protein
MLEARAGSDDVRIGSNPFRMRKSSNLLFTAQANIDRLLINLSIIMWCDHSDLSVSVTVIAVHFDRTGAGPDDVRIGSNTFRLRKSSYPLFTALANIDRLSTNMSIKIYCNQSDLYVSVAFVAFTFDRTGIGPWASY